MKLCFVHSSVRFPCWISIWHLTWKVQGSKVRCWGGLNVLSVIWLERLQSWFCSKAREVLSCPCTQATKSLFTTIVWTTHHIKKYYVKLFQASQKCEVIFCPHSFIIIIIKLSFLFKNVTRTCLHWACKRNHKHIVSYLLSCGADIDILTSKDELASQLTSKPEIKRLLGGKTDISRSWIIPTCTEG